MADLRTLRRKLEAEITMLQEKLRALDVVEREIGGRGRSRTRIPRSGTVTEACRQVVLGDPSKLWTPADVLAIVKSDGAPKATKGNVSTALRRLAKKQHILEVVSGNRRVGLTYRVKEGVKD